MQLVGRIVTLIGDGPKGATRYRVLDALAQPYFTSMSDRHTLTYGDRPEQRVRWWLLAATPEGYLVYLRADDCKLRRGGRRR